MTRLRLVRVCFLLTLMVLLFQATASAADRSIQNFLSQREQWPRLLGVTQTLEGRLSTFNSRSLRFRNCPIPFQIAGPIPKLDDTFKNVEVTGQLERQNGRIVFMVKSLQKQPGDLEQFVRDESRLDRTKPRDWYALAEWGMKRAEFYDDQKLKQKALEAYQTGIKQEYDQLAVKEPDALMRLADRAKEFQLDPQLINGFKHEALIREWEDLTKQKQNDQKTFVAKLLKVFPSAKTPQKQDLPAERKRYLENPVEVFNQADKASRERLVRWFYAQILLDNILKELSAGGSNGFDIAARIEKQVPERAELVKQYQVMQLDFDLNRVGELSRQYVLDLSAEYKKRGDEKKAKQTLVNWLEARRKKLDAGDADGRVSLARDLIEITENREAATELLLAAWKLNPKSAEAAALLGRLGFMLQKDQWLNPQQVKEFRDDPIRKAIRNGTVIAGMNRDQVRKVLGAPTQVGRSISGGAVNELWIYGEASNQSLIVQLARKQRDEEFKVIRIKNSQRAESPLNEDPVE